MWEKVLKLRSDKNETRSQPPTNPQTGVLGGPQFTQRQMMSHILTSQSGLASTYSLLQDKLHWFSGNLNQLGYVEQPVPVLF